MQICVCKWLHPPTAHDCIGVLHSLMPPPGYPSMDMHLDSPHTARRARILLPSRDERNLARCNCTGQQPAWISQFSECLVYTMGQFTQTVDVVIT